MDTGAPLRVLVAEDDPGCRALTARIIRELGHTPLPADGEAAALRLFRSEDCGLVLTDLAMEKPDSGLRVATAVRRLRPGTPVILMTGRPGTDTAIPGLRAGACDYLIKPFRPRELRASIRRALARRRLAPELDMERASRAELHAAYSQLAKVERLREAMLAIVGHELRTPLYAAEMAAHLLAGAEPGPSAARTQELLERNLARLRVTVEEFLLHAKLAAGRVSAAPRPADLLALVRREADGVRPLAEERGLALSIEVAGAARPTPLDEELAAQAVRHLLLNAVRFNRDAGAIRVAVSFEAEQARVSVCDDGPGIPAAELGRVFDPFYQTADYLTRRVGGLGLGLAVVRLAMDAHGGAVHTASAPGEGARFTLVFPIYALQAAEGSYVV
ncbi:MAG: ATP-binding protein [Elusimicrobia bacterium]|nr:ATP-binding protein [Elusimicrobiota bacterium]